MENRIRQLQQLLQMYPDFAYFYCYCASWFWLLYLASFCSRLRPSLLPALITCCSLALEPPLFSAVLSLCCSLALEPPLFCCTVPLLFIGLGTAFVLCCTVSFSAARCLLPFFFLWLLVFGFFCSCPFLEQEEDCSSAAAACYLLSATLFFPLALSLWFFSYLIKQTDLFCRCFLLYPPCYFFFIGSWPVFFFFCFCTSLGD
mmetsp:Transcript_16868/g.21995  ORF Transcript_16868/g.21995 Transcript_16868/m.21995 type:complete len:202 (-) Transcript_16868:245-850(-)